MNSIIVYIQIFLTKQKTNQKTPKELEVYLGFEHRYYPNRIFSRQEFAHAI